MKLNYLKKLLLAGTIVIAGLNTNAQIVADGVYQIYNSNLDETVEVDTTAPYDAHLTASDELDDYQLWTFTHQGDDVYKIVNNGNSKALGIKDNWCNQFGDVQANFLEADTNVEFKIRHSSIGGSYTFEIAFTTCNYGSVNDPARAFDVADGASGAQIQTYDISSSNSNQQFQLLVPSSVSTNNLFLSNALTIFYSKERGLVIKAKQVLKGSKLNIDMYDISGRKIKSNTITTNSSEETILLNTIDKGVYLVQFSDQFNHKLIKKIIVY